MNATLTCPVQGNPDLYGLGIRLGIYIQMLTVQLSSLSSAILHTRDTLGQATIIFVLATLAVLVRQLIHTAIQPVEVFPILTLLLAQARVCRVPYHRNHTTAAIYVAELLGLVVLFVWFWWHGMDTLPRACPDDKAFFFAKVSIWHWFRTFNKVTSVLFAAAAVLAAVVYAMGLLSYFVIWGVDFVRRVRGGQGAHGAAASSSAAVRTEEDREAEAALTLGGSSDFLVNVGAIVFVEMSLKWNRISGVHSLTDAGQFMPFFVSLAQLVSVLYDGAKTGLHLAVAEDSGLGDWESRDEHEDWPCQHDSRLLTKGHTGPFPLANVPPSLKSRDQGDAIFTA